MGKLHGSVRKGPPPHLATWKPEPRGYPSFDHDANHKSTNLQGDATQNRVPRMVVAKDHKRCSPMAVYKKLTHRHINLPCPCGDSTILDTGDIMKIIIVIIIRKSSMNGDIYLYI